MNSWFFSVVKAQEATNHQPHLGVMFIDFSWIFIDLSLIFMDFHWHLHSAHSHLAVISGAPQRPQASALAVCRRGCGCCANQPLPACESLPASGAPEAMEPDDHPVVTNNG